MGGLAQIGIPGLILILVVALIIFGPSKLPEIGKAAGETFKEFKNSANELMSDEDDSKEETESSSEEKDENN